MTAFIVFLVLIKHAMNSWLNKGGAQLCIGISASADGGLRSRDPPLGPPSTLAEIFRRTCLGGGK